MILAAGFGTRLSPVTDTLPKALVPVADKPMIDYAIRACKSVGCSSIVINCFHLAGMMKEHFRSTDYGVPITLFVEDEILGTGGGILNARTLLEDTDCFLVHNADIVSDFPLLELVEAHIERKSFATLALHSGRTSRGVMFDQELNFLGKECWAEDGMRFPDTARRYGFTGIHVVDAEFFRCNFEEGFSDVFDLYRSAMGSGKRITGVLFDQYWSDLGTMEKIAMYEERIRQR